MAPSRRIPWRLRRFGPAVAACSAVALAFALTRSPRPADPAPRVPSLVTPAAKAAWTPAPPASPASEESFDLSTAHETSRRERFPEHSVGGFISDAVAARQAAIADGADTEPAPTIDLDATAGELASEQALENMNRELADLRDHFAKTEANARVIWVQRLLVELEGAHMALSREGFPDAADEVTEAIRLLTFVQPAARGETGTRETSPDRVAWRIASALRCCEEALAKVTGEQGS